MANVSQEKQDKIRRAARGHEQHCEDLWHEMVWELSMRLGLQEDTVMKVLEGE